MSIGNIVHKRTVIKDKTASYTYAIELTDFTSREVSFSLPLSRANQIKWLSIVALHQAYHHLGRKAFLTALDEYYALLQKEGYNVYQMRRENLEIYREVSKSALSRSSAPIQIGDRVLRIERKWKGTDENHTPEKDLQYLVADVRGDFYISLKDQYGYWYAHDFELIRDGKVVS